MRSSLSIERASRLAATPAGRVAIGSVAVPLRLRPTAPIAADAILVGDPGRALLLAQELVAEPKMSNHARGLWGYFGKTPEGVELTIQATGMGGPSAVLVLEDLAELGVRRAVRVGTCVALSADLEPGELVLVGEAVAAGGSAGPLGVEVGERVLPDGRLSDRIGDALGPGHEPAAIASFDAHPARQSPRPEVAADMQTAPLLAAAPALGIAAAALLIVTERAGGVGRLDVEALAAVERAAGLAALGAFSP
jgi:purine-nucleoside phosphorylase